MLDLVDIFAVLIVGTREGIIVGETWGMMVAEGLAEKEGSLVSIMIEVGTEIGTEVGTIAPVPNWGVKPSPTMISGTGSLWDKSFST